MSRWIGVAVYTALLYTTLPFGRPLLNVIKGVLGSSFSFSVNLFLAGTAVILLVSFKPRPVLSFRDRPVLILIGIALTLLVSPIAMPEERIHLIQYAGLGYLALRAAQPLRRSDQMVDPSQISDPSPGEDRPPVLIDPPVLWRRVLQGGAGYAFGVIFLVGVGDEIIQALLPSRVFDLRDILFNIIGGTTGILLQAGTQPGSLSS